MCLQRVIARFEPPKAEEVMGFKVVLQRTKSRAHLLQVFHGELPTTSQSRREAYSRNSTNCISGFCPLSTHSCVDTYSHFLFP